MPRHLDPSTEFMLSEVEGLRACLGFPRRGMVYKTEYNIKSFKSARSGRVTKVILAPPLLIYSVFGISVLLQIPAGYVLRHVSFTLGMLLNQLGTLLIPVLIVIRLFGLTGKEVLPFKKIAALKIITAIIMMCSLAVISDYLIFLTEWALPVSKTLDEAYKELMHVRSFGSYIYKFSFLCIIPSFCEEIFFRGFCQTGLQRHYGKAGGILIVAAMFAVAHLSPWYVHLYFILGIFLGWLFATSGSLWIPIICHIANNFWTFTAHSLGWRLPLMGESIWWNIPIILVSLAVLALTVYMWNRISSLDTT